MKNDTIILEDELMWIEFLDVSVNVHLMYSSSCPDPSYLVRIGQHNYFGNKDDFLLTKIPISIGLDYDFFSSVLAKFVKSKKLIDTRWGDFDDYSFSFIGYPDNMGYCETFINVAPYYYFDDKNCDYSQGGLAVAISSKWEILDKLSWQLQCMELEALIKEIKKLQQESFNPVFETLREGFQKQLENNRQILETWGQIEAPSFIQINFR